MRLAELRRRQHAEVVRDATARLQAIHDLDEQARVTYREALKRLRRPVGTSADEQYPHEEFA